ncbi:mandelate racemase/muconate lactonizing enzyme family protein [Flagellimonas sp. 389]|uniref:mandelate racemase/muconate lactonizing enzyme family protein n=1 Tax=Flagellimonas sp. 389 TaxID=2835862 RepID=UPI001BD39BB2|nr:mandelate racemase/muconate lactonizing enzyme family protein [Flagellimonas sp. 389]MBS9462624.1 mandelate racemase/muconate lactonizing enzyme family protein [Flagellimonas sp. 389]
MNRANFIKTISSATLATGLPFPMWSCASKLSANTILGFDEMAKDDDFIIKDIDTFLLRKALFVSVELNNGIKGWAEAMPNDKRSSRTLIEKTLKNYYEGTNIFDAEKTWDLCIKSEYDLGPGGLLTYSISGIDCAIYDALGKATKKPVYELLGGKLRDSVEIYASFTRDVYPTPEKAAEKAKQLVAEGYNAMKFRMRWGLENQDPPNDNTTAFAAALKKGVGSDIKLAMDANMGHSRDRAIELGKELEAFDLAWWEEPTAPYDYDAIKAVVEQVNIPIVFGEHAYTVEQIKHLLNYGGSWAVNPDLLKCGGFTGGKRIGDYIANQNVKLVAHNSRPSLSTVCMLHWVCATKMATEPQEFALREKAPGAFDALTGFPEFKDGRLYISDRPGLGVEVDEDQVRAYDKKYTK